MVISVLNRKNGVGSSLIANNISNILELPFFMKDKEQLQLLFNNERISAIKDLYKKNTVNDLINTYINKYIDVGICSDTNNLKTIKSGVYDIGSENFEYKYSKRIIKQSDVIIIPTELSYEVHIQTRLTIRYINKIFKDNPPPIFIIFNRLDRQDNNSEKTITTFLTDNLIEKENGISKDNIFYLRTNYNLFMNNHLGNIFLDRFISIKKTDRILKINKTTGQDVETLIYTESMKWLKEFSTFEILEYCRLVGIDSLLQHNQYRIKYENIIKNADWYKPMKNKYYKYEEEIFDKYFSYMNQNIYSKLSVGEKRDRFRDNIFNKTNLRLDTKLIKDLLIITTFIKNLNKED